MFKGAFLFVLIFVGISPNARTFLLGVGKDLNAWAPFSYITLVILVSGLVASIVLVKTWPERVEPESPMAKYRNENPFDE